MTFDTGTWGAATDASEEAQAQRRQEREEREAELRRIAEENRAARAREASARARQAARDEAEIAARAEADARAAAQAQAARQASEKENIAKAAKGQTEMDKIEAALAQVRKEKQARSNAMQRAARASLNTSSNASSSSSSSSSSASASSRSSSSSASARPRDGPRGRVRVNPVTGALETIADAGNDGKVQEGCLRLDKKYMNAALAAGLGAGKGMYGHIGTISKQFNGRHNTGGRPQDGPQYSRESAAASTGRATGRGSMSRVKVENGIATITSKTSNPNRQRLTRNPNFNRRAAGACDLGGNPIRGDQKRPPKKNMKNVKRMVQGRSSSVGKGGRGKGGRTGYMREKGVVATLGGATSASTQRYQAKKAQEKESARQQERLGARKPASKPRRQAVAKKLGGAGPSGGGGGGGGGDRDAMRAARLAALERRGLA